MDTLIFNNEEVILVIVSDIDNEGDTEVYAVSKKWAIENNVNEKSVRGLPPHLWIQLLEFPKLNAITLFTIGE